MARPETIENRWDILYQDYPDVYDAFSNTPYHPTVYEGLQKIVDTGGKTIADVGSGTGNSSVAFARYAKRVIGIEREPGMLQRAIENHKEQTSKNVSFLAGDALALPLANSSVDLVTGITLALYPPEQYRDFIREGRRVATGRVIYVGIPPGWYGGELAHMIDEKDEGAATIERIFLEEFHGGYYDIFSVQDYGSVDHMVNTYGFIFGKRVIQYLKQTQKTTVRWKFRAYYLPG